MKEVQVSDGIVPPGEFKAQAAKLLKRVGESGEPMVITQNGRSACSSLRGSMTGSRKGSDDTTSSFLPTCALESPGVSSYQ